MTIEEDKLSFLNRDERGRFAPKETEPEPVVEKTKVSPEPAEPVKAETPTPAAPPASPAEPVPPPSSPTPAPAPIQVPPGYVPIQATLDEREKRQAIQRELEDYKRRYEEATRKPVELDPIGDQDGFVRHFEQQLARTRFDTLATFSKTIASKDHGLPAIEAAEQWLAEEVKRNPGFWQSVESNPHPYDFVVKAHKRSLLLADMGEDPDAWVKRRAAELGLLNPLNQTPAGTPAVAPPQQPATPLPRPSLASAPAASSTTPKGPTGPGVAFGGVFAN